MKRTFLLMVDAGTDTDFIALSDDIVQACLEKGINALNCKPWKTQELSPTPLSVPNSPPALQ